MTPEEATRLRRIERRARAVVDADRKWDQALSSAADGELAEAQRQVWNSIRALERALEARR